jgi:hypothetical protein
VHLVVGVREGEVCGEMVTSDGRIHWRWGVAQGKR